MNKGLLRIHEFLLNIKSFLCIYIRYQRKMILSNFCEFIPVFQSPDIKSVHLVCVKKYFLKQ